MKADLDSLMKARGFDAFVIFGEDEGNHTLAYMTHHAKITHGIVVKKQGDEAVLIVGGMERDEAAKSGLKILTITGDFNYYAIAKEAENLFEARLLLYKTIFERLNISGTVAFYGVSDPGDAFMFLSRLDALLPDISVTGEPDTTLFDVAYTTKDSHEVAAIKDVAEKTNLVMGEIIDFIKSHRPTNDILTNAAGEALTVGLVKRYLQERLMAYRLNDKGSTIFAVNRDAGIPHSRGEDSDSLKLGDTIVCDLFPYSTESGYFHDMTRTFCLGHAPDKVQRAYDQVMQSFTAVMDSLKVGEKCSYYQELTCNILEEHGHKTIRTHPGTDEGYVHSLGHGLGLQIHSHPRFSSLVNDTIEAGQVFTIEPGVYYPDKGYGVRIEDTVYVDSDGVFHSLTPYPKDLVIAFD